MSARHTTKKQMRKFRPLFYALFVLFGITVFQTMPAIACTSSEIEIDNNCIDSKFTVTTTSLTANAEFKFVLSAAGTFYVDWGEGTPQVETITRNNTTPTEYSHTYPTAGEKKIKFAGVATEYNTTNYSNDKDASGAAIRFGAAVNKVTSSNTGGTPTLVKKLEGSIGSVFPTLGTADNQNPIFFELCAGCTNLTTISGTLFSGVTTAKKNLFRSVFDKCTNLQAIPADLFSYTYGSAESMFRSAFYQCKNLSVFPDNLFPHIDGPAANMFMYAFYEVVFKTANQYIPADTFQGLNGLNANQLFNNAFKGSNLLEQCPEGTTDVTTVNYNNYKSSWNNKKACEVIQILSCTGATYKDGNLCLPCPTGYTSDNQDGKTDITDCKISCPAGKWTGEYQKLEYIEATGTQYIDTLHPITSTTFSAELEFSSGQYVTGNIGHFGGNQDATSGHAANFKESKFGLWVVDYTDGNSAGSKITTGGSFNADVIKHIRYDFVGDTRELSVDGNSTGAKTFSGSIISNNTYRLFSNGCVGGCNDKLLEGRIHWFKVYENGELIFDFIPVRRMSDNEIGMYDQVSGTFFGNAGTGTFTPGTVLGTIGGNSCENVGIGYYSSASTTSYGSVSTRTQCAEGLVTLTETSTSANDCISAQGFTVCPAGTYLPANSQTCTACTAGNWCPGGQLYFNTTDQGLHSCATEIGSGWSSDAGSDTQTDCYYLITLDKNGYTGIIDAYSGIGCSVVSTAEGKTNAQLKLFYNTKCTLPSAGLPATGGYDSVHDWSTTSEINDNAVTIIPATTTTPSVTTYYARKTCAANYYKSNATTCSACGANSSTLAGNTATACACTNGYTVDGTSAGATTSTTGCIEILQALSELHAGNKIYNLLVQKRTTPSINVGLNGSVFYTSLIQSAIPGELGVTYENKTYSACDIDGDYCIVNGNLYWADPDLYLTSGQSQYINTGVVPDLNTAIEIEMADRSSLTYSLFGVKTGTLATTDTGFGISLTSGNFGFFRNGTSMAAIPKDNNYHVYYLSNTEASVDGVSYNFSPATEPISGQYPMYMFGTNHKGSANDKPISVKYLKIWSGSTLTHHFVPVPSGLVIGNYTVPSNGMFDIVTQTFYGNDGIGSFTYGKL